MTDTPWTPGPWETEWDDFGDGEGLQKTIGAPSDPLIAIVGFGIGSVERVEDFPAEFAANARLIAAAPEMAELLDELAVETWDHDMRDLTDKARAMLARIRGEA